MKVAFEHLKKTINWIEANTNEVNVSIVIDGRKMIFKVFDKYESEIVIELYEDATLLPKIKKTDILE